MKVYTKTGDKGTTSLLGGTRVPKHHLRIECYGTVDELNSWLGFLNDQHEDLEYKAFIKNIQDNLFTIGSYLASDPSKTKIKLPELTENIVSDLEESIDRMTAGLPELKNFVLPGGHPANSSAHIARCVCRRAERLVVALSDSEAVQELILVYLNRLSDWLFVFAREMSRQAGAKEVPWEPRS